MIPGRLFTFGCSFTKYHYPTWADLLGKEWEYFENWGSIGSGNSYIFHSVIECCQRNNLGPNDTVIMLWSGLTRMDFYQHRSWRTFRDLSLNNYSDDIPQHCPDGYEINSFSLMDAIHNTLENKKIKFHSLTWVDYDRETRVAKFFKDTLDQVKFVDFELNKQAYTSLPRYYIQKKFSELWNVFAGPDWPEFDDFISNTYTAKSPEIELELEDFKKKILLADQQTAIRLKSEIDHHPLPTQHLASLQKHLPEYKISDSTIQWAHDCEKNLLNNQPLDFKICLLDNRL